MRSLRTLSIPMAAAALAATLSLPALAQVEEEVISGPKTRDQVVAELQQPHALDYREMTRGEQSYAPDFAEAMGADVMYSNHQLDADVSVSMSSDTSREVAFAPTAAGGKSRAQVIEELELARADGSLDRMWSETGFAPEFEAAQSSRP